MNSINSGKDHRILQAGWHHRIPPIVILVFCIIAGCQEEVSSTSPNAFSSNTSSATKTWTELPTTTLTPTKIRLTRTPTRTQPSSTNTATIVYPPEYDRIAALTLIEPGEILAIYTTIHNALAENDPEPLAMMVHYPLIGCQRCGGLVIETPEDFIRSYPTLLDESTRLQLLKEKEDEIGGNWEGVMFGRGAIWVSGLCENKPHPSCGVFIVKFGNYCQYWYDRKLSENLRVNAVNFSFGRYAVEPFIMEADGRLDNDDIKEISNSRIVIFPNRFLADPSGWFGESCQTAVIEFCPPHKDSFHGYSSIGTLNIVCENKLEEIFEIYSTKRLAKIIFQGTAGRIYLKYIE